MADKKEKQVPDHIPENVIWNIMKDAFNENKQGGEANADDEHDQRIEKNAKTQI